MAAEQFKQLHAYLDQQIIGQHALTKSILIALLADGHLLVEGPPGLAKTRAINALANGRGWRLSSSSVYTGFVAC